MTNYYIEPILIIYLMVSCSVQQVTLNNSVVSPSSLSAENGAVWDIVDDTDVDAVNEQVLNGDSWITLWQNLFPSTTNTPTGGSGGDNSGEEIVQQEEENCLKCRCGIPNTAKKIVGGTQTHINQYPWMGLITFGSRLHCGSSVINDRYVLTAAHCVKGYNLKRFTITLLEHDRLDTSESQTIKFKVESGMVHIHYNESTFDNDLALLRLDQIIKFNNKLRPVCLPRHRLSFAGALGIVTGWGDTSEEGYDSNTLQEVELPILSNNECRKTGYGESRITDNMLCAVDLDGGKDTCQGDSGGPLHVIKKNVYQIAGIVSFGDGCAEPDYPGVYTRVNRYSSWIGTNTIEACYCDN